MRGWLAFIREIDEHHPVDRQNTLARDFVPNLTPQRDRRTAEFGRCNTEFDDIALARRTHEIDLRDQLGHHALVAQLGNHIDRGFFVDPFEQAAAEQGAIFRTNTIVKVYLDCFSVVISCHALTKFD